MVASLTTHDQYPPFPSNLRTAPLESLSLAALQRYSSTSTSFLHFFKACQELGFFYLDLTGSELGESILKEAEELHTLQQKFFALPHQVKDDYGRDKTDPFFSYRWTACPDGVKDVW